MGQSKNSSRIYRYSSVLKLSYYVSIKKWEIEADLQKVGGGLVALQSMKEGK